MSDMWERSKKPKAEPTEEAPCQAVKEGNTYQVILKSGKEIVVVTTSNDLHSTYRVALADGWQLIRLNGEKDEEGKEQVVVTLNVAEITAVISVPKD